MTEADVARELAWIEVENEPPPAEGETSTMSDEQFYREVGLASRGAWDELDLDELPDGWQPSTISDLRGAGAS